MSNVRGNLKIGGFTVPIELMLEGGVDTPPPPPAPGGDEVMVNLNVNTNLPTPEQFEEWRQRALQMDNCPPILHELLTDFSAVRAVNGDQFIEIKNFCDAISATIGIESPLVVSGASQPPSNGGQGNSFDGEGDLTDAATYLQKPWPHDGFCVAVAFLTLEAPNGGQAAFTAAARAFKVQGGVGTPVGAPISHGPDVGLDLSGGSDGRSFCLVVNPPPGWEGAHWRILGGFLN